MSLDLSPAATASKPVLTNRPHFRLLRYFSIAALLSFTIVGAALYVMERSELAFFADVQEGQSRLFREAQSELSVETEQTARRSLIKAQEAANVNLTHLFANSLWDSHIAPFLARAQAISPDRCRALASNDTEAAQACQGEIGLRLKSLPGFADLDQRAIATMRNSTVFKIKVFDLRGLTIYSSDHRQIGEDKRANAGWRSAAGGRAASELTHRDHFSSFEGVVENRDLISSYIPVRRGKDNEVVGVFEIYADVTPLLEQITLSSEQLARLIAANQGKIEQTAKRDVDMVAEKSGDLLRVVGGMLVLLFITLMVIVRRGQAIIDAQRAVQERSIAQEHLWHREKMAAMSALAANVSHDTGNALTIIASLGQQLADKLDGDSEAAEAADSIQEQSRRIFRMTRQISAFATVSDRPEYTSVNPVIEAVCYFFSFDRRFRRPIEFRPGEQLPWCDLVPDFLKEVLMNLLPTLSGRIVIETGPCSKGVRIRVRVETDDMALGPEEDSLRASRMEIVAQRLGDMGGTLAVGEQGSLFDIELPAVMREDSPH
ncbi:MAG: histidine kinase [Rhodocyclales bacterium]|nr:histidine kinase [Rhodocyclales bacterium]